MCDEDNMASYLLAYECQTKAVAKADGIVERNDGGDGEVGRETVRTMRGIVRRARASAAKERDERSVSSESKDAMLAQNNVYATLER